MAADPINVPPADLEPAERREQLLTVAADIIRSEGLHAASLKRIAATAGISETQAYNYFPTRERLFGELAIGEFLPAERTLCENLGVSRSVLREALGRLARDGLAVNRPGVGYFAVEFDARVIEEVYEFRLSLEVTAARAAAKRIGENGIAELKGLLRELAAFERRKKPTVDELPEEVDPVGDLKARREPFQRGPLRTVTDHPVAQVRVTRAEHREQRSSLSGPARHACLAYR